MTCATRFTAGFAASGGHAKDHRVGQAACAWLRSWAPAGNAAPVHRASPAGATARRTTSTPEHHLILAGLEPAIFGSEDQRLIH